MATAEVPVSDILCEATEYLSKLGSNLRTRSENLKERRICKNRLRNAHAVHKAAKKVLLICELSKKSLENVESGVRKVLAMVDAAQAPTAVGGKRDEKSKHGDKRFYYFNYDSHKLRISKKISITHFTGVKVLARGMPVSMLDKYPVFYNCKLKRKRSKLLDKESAGELGRSSKRKNSSSSLKNQNTDKSNECNKLVVSDASESENSNRNDDKTRTVRRESSDVVINSDAERVINEKINTLEIQDENSESPNEENNTKLNKSRQETKKSKEDLAVNELIESFANEAKVDEDTPNKRKTQRGEKEATGIRKKFSKITIADDSSDSDEPIKKDNGQNSTLNKNKSDHSNENEVNKENITESEPKIKRIKLGETDEYSNCKDDSDDNSNENNNSENDSKPMIRCVNITQLLKPELNSKSKETSKNNHLTTTNKSINKEKVRRSSKNCSITLKEDSAARKKDRDMKNKSDDEYWARKRNEVKQFKAKKFTVNINKLPKLTMNFLLIHNLKKIVQGSKTICEIEKGNLEENIDEVKNALLNESGSEDTDTALAAETNKVKNTLLNDSDSDDKITSEQTVDSNQINQKELTNTAAIKDALLHESDSENNDRSTSVKDKTVHSAANEEKVISEQIKNALLNDSDSDKNQNDDKVNETPKSDDNNKNISHKSDENNTSVNSEVNNTSVNSEVIKSSLLNDSDSDQNGKNNKCKQSDKTDQGESTQDSEAIKSSLLNESDSDQNQNDNTIDKPNNNDENKTIPQNHSDITEQSESTHDTEKVKSALLNNSSDSEEKLPAGKKKKKIKMSRHKRNDAKKNLLHYSSSSDNENENSHESDKDFKKSPYKHSRRKSRISSSSSNEEHGKKSKLQESCSQEQSNKTCSDNEDKDSRSIDQIDGTIDEDSNSSVSKVRT